MISITLYQPDIPQNVGSALRLTACFDVPCHIIEPCGFVYDDKKLKRVAMDYAELAVPVRHSSWDAFLNWRKKNDYPRIILLSSKAKTYHHQFVFQPTDILLMGRESAGVPVEVKDVCDASLRIPIAAHTRSLNVITAATVVLGEALRQTGGWPDQL